MFMESENENEKQKKKKKNWMLCFFLSIVKEMVQ